MNGSSGLRHIGEIARRCGVSTHTLRYYEKEGLLGKPRRTDKGYRLYPEDTIQRLRFLKKAQVLGLTLKEIKGIMKCSQEGLRPCCDLVRSLFSQKIDEFESKIAELQKMKRNLEGLLLDWVSPEKARKRSYTVCPQIEREPDKKRR